MLLVKASLIIKWAILQNESLKKLSLFLLKELSLLICLIEFVESFPFCTLEQRNALCLLKYWFLDLINLPLIIIGETPILFDIVAKLLIPKSIAKILETFLSFSSLFITIVSLKL